MSKTNFATDNALTKKVWEEELFRDVEKESYFSRFHGKSAESLVHEKTMLEKEQGDKITFGIRMRLSGAGVSGSQVLEGNEERLSTYNDDVTLELYRHGVRDDGAMSRKRAMFSIDEEARSAIKTWGAEKIDQMHFDALAASPTLNAYLNSSGVFTLDATNSDAVTGLHATNSKITPAFLSALRTYAQTGGGRTYIPLRPVKVSGKSYYVYLTHPDVAYDLKQNSVIQASWQQAQERGSDNPLFKNAEIVWDGVVVHTHENVAIGFNGSSVPYAQGYFLGAQSLVWAYGKRPWVVQKEFDFDNEHGYAFNFIAGVTKPQFNSKDYGSFAVVAARTNVSGATIN